MIPRMAATPKPLTMTCPHCGPAKQRVAQSRVVFDRAHVITCMELACGHAWHRTMPNVRGLFPGSLRNATFAPCDCPSESPRP